LISVTEYKKGIRLTHFKKKLQVFSYSWERCNQLQTAAALPFLLSKNGNQLPPGDSHHSNKKSLDYALTLKILINPALQLETVMCMPWSKHDYFDFAVLTKF
jgi:hypothetical protein